MSLKRFLDIEQVLRWAYRDELPKRVAVGPSFADMLRPPSADFGHDDGAVREPGHPAALGEPHPDALAIEAAVRNLADWRGHTFGADDAAGLAWGFAGLNIDLESAALEAVATMPAAIAVHARAGARPKWSAGTPRPYRPKTPNGKALVLIEEAFVEIYDKRRDRNRLVPVAEMPGRRVPPGSPTIIQTIAAPPLRSGLYRVGAYCPLEYRPDPVRLVRERAEWAAWRMGLQLLWENLEGRLETIAPLPPAAPWRPWAGETETYGRPPQLFRHLRTSLHARETREQQAARRRRTLRREWEPRIERSRPVIPPTRRGETA